MQKNYFLFFAFAYTCIGTLNMEINTLNESALHKQLKNIYSLDEGSITESKENGFIYDIVQKDGSVIEIQTKNVSSLLKKALKTLNAGRKLKIVNPVISEKIIETYNANGILISRRKSPKKESIYSVFRELTGIYPILLNENFTLELVFISMTETRIKTDEKQQSRNKRRRFKKDWIKTGKKLNEIIAVKKMNSRKDYLSLIPENIPSEFTTNEIAFELNKNPDIKGKSKYYASIFIWVLNKMNLIEQIGKKGRKRIFRIKKEQLH